MNSNVGPRFRVDFVKFYTYGSVNNIWDPLFKTQTQTWLDFSCIQLTLSVCLDCTKNNRCLRLCFFVWVSCIVHETCKYGFQQIFSLKLAPTTLLTHLKIILLQYFQFSVISSIQTNPKYKKIDETMVFKTRLNRDWRIKKTKDWFHLFFN